MQCGVWWAGVRVALALCALGASTRLQAASDYRGPWVEIGLGSGIMLGGHTATAAHKAGNASLGMTVVPWLAVGAELSQVHGRSDDHCRTDCDTGLYTLRQSLLVEYRPPHGCLSYRLAGVKYRHANDDDTLRARGYGAGLHAICHWPVDRRDEVSLGLRGGLELARLQPRGGAPAFWNGALVLTVQLRFKGALWGWF